MTIRKGKEQEIQFDDDGRPFAMWGERRAYLDQFHRELVRFVDWNREFWHGMDCTTDLVIHIARDNETCILGKVSA